METIGATSSPTKQFVTYQTIQDQSIKMAAGIHEYLRRDGVFEFDEATGKYARDAEGRFVLKRKIWFVALWRGGCYYGLQIQGILDMAGVTVDHVAIRTSSYTGVNAQQSSVLVHNISYITEHCSPADVLIVVDDVFDSGRTIEALQKKIQEKARLNAPIDMLVATGFWKPEKNKTLLQPDFVGGKVGASTWLVFPHEYADLNDVELMSFVGGDEAAKPYLDLKKKFGV